MTYHAGGIIHGPRNITVTLDDDECVLDPRTLQCKRTDLRHNTEAYEVRTLSGAVSYHRGPCIHRHPLPVESVVTGEVVARLCPACDQQLP